MLYFSPSNYIHNMCSHRTCTDTFYYFINHVVRKYVATLTWPRAMDSNDDGCVKARIEGSRSSTTISEQTSKLECLCQDDSSDRFLDHDEDEEVGSKATSY